MHKQSPPQFHRKGSFRTAKALIIIMTLTKLAEIAGTSVSTISKAFSGSKEISEETRERIFKIAKELDCFDKYYKAPRSRPMIALLPPEPESEYYGREIGMLERELNARGADTLIAFTRFDCKQEARLFRELVYGMKVDGIILWSSGVQINNPDEIPLVAITSYDKVTKNADAVKIDIESGMLELVKTIKEYGHTQIGFIGESLTTSKELKFKDAMRRVGLPIHNKYISVSNNRFAKAGEYGMRELIERNAVPSVIVAAYDPIAYGAMQYAKKRGYRIPDDISFVGMDDISTTPYLGIPLSSVHINFEDVCPQIVDLIFKRIENRHYRSRTKIIVPVTVNIRKSLKHINKNIK